MGVISVADSQYGGAQRRFLMEFTVLSTAGNRKLMLSRSQINLLIPASTVAIVNSPGFVLMAVSADPWQSFSANFAPASLMCIALYALMPSFSTWLFLLLTPLALLEMLYVLRYGRVTDEHVLAVITESNFQEAFAWLGPVGLIVITISILMIFLSVILLRNFFIFPQKLSTRWRKILLLTGLISFGLTQVSELLGIEPKNPGNRDQTGAQAVRGTEDIGLKLTGQFEHSTLYETFPWGIPLRIYRYIVLQEGLSTAQHALADFTFAASQSPGRTVDDELFVLVIGETGRPDRWQLNGYERSTNPRLGAQEGVVSFTNATTSWAWTRMSVPIILSRKPASLVTSFFPERSILTAFREAGFWTAWYSMHGALGFHESAVALYASEADDTRYLNPAGYQSPGAYDANLFQPLDEALIRNDKKKFIVLHTMGSHFNYAHRFPPEFDFFTPSIRERRDADLHDQAQREYLNNSYDNSIRYTDHFLTEVIQRLAASGRIASMLYVADHGENLFDGQCNKAGHGHNTEFDYRIAALWWNSAAFSERYPEKVAYISARRDISWSTENVFNTLLDAAGIEIRSKKKGNNSLLARDFVAMPRWIQSGIYFDDAIPEGACGILKRRKLDE